MTDHSFAARLNRPREEAGLSQYELAKRTGLTRQTFSRLEMGQSVPTWPTVQLLARALGVDCTAFIDPALQLLEAESARPKGRPRKDAGQGEPPPAKKSKRKS